MRAPRQRFQTLFAADPEDARLINEAGNCYFRLERYDEAEACYARALAQRPDDAPTLFNVGLAQSLALKNDDAWNTFQRLLDLEPEYVAGYFEAGKICQREQRWDDALQLFETVIIKDTLQSGNGAFRPMDGRLQGLSALNRARIWLLHADDEAAGLGQVALLLERFQDTARVLQLAQELIAAGALARAQLVLAALLAAAPGHEEATRLYTSMT